MRTAISFYFLIALVLCQCTSSSRNDTAQLETTDSVTRPLVGMYLFVPGIDTEKFFSDCKSWGVNMVFTNSAYWNQDFVNEAKRSSMDLALLFPVFFNQEYLEAHPEDYCITSKGNRAIKDWLHFGCPSSGAFREHQKNYLRKTLPLIDPKIVTLDFIRFYVHWERVTPDVSFMNIEDGCYCDRCMQNFQDYSGKSMTGKSPDWIKQHALEQWTEWKCQLIDSTVAEFAGIVKDYRLNLPVGIKTVPWKNGQYNDGIRSIAGQDLVRLKDRADFFMPMTYNHLLGEKPEWINELLVEVNNTVEKEVYATVQFEKVFQEQDGIGTDEFKMILDQALRQPSDGFVLFHYIPSNDNTARAAIVSNAVR